MCAVKKSETPEGVDASERVEMTRILHFVFVASVALSVLTLMHYYIWRQLVKKTDLPRPWRHVATGVILFLGLSLPAIIIVDRVASTRLPPVVFYGPYIWMGTMFFLFLMLLLPQASRWLVRLYRRRRKERVDFGRRMFLTRSLAGVATVSTVGLSAFSVSAAARQAGVKKVRVNLERWPLRLSGYRIVQITDLHIGLTLDGEFVRRVVEQVNGLSPDLIAITGDLLDGAPEQIQGELVALRELKARDGVYFVTGNHEYYSGVEAWMPVLRGLGLRVLRNERVTLGSEKARWDLLGVDDYNAEGMAPGHGSDLKAALAGRDETNETILLAHQPRSVFEAAEADIGLVLSGHTHGGQIWPWNHLVYLQQPYLKGLHLHGPRTQIYVSEGTGYWGPPMRLGTRGEITALEIHRGRGA